MSTYRKPLLNHVGFCLALFQLTEREKAKVIEFRLVLRTHGPGGLTDPGRRFSLFYLNYMLSFALVFECVYIITPGLGIQTNRCHDFAKVHLMTKYLKVINFGRILKWWITIELRTRGLTELLYLMSAWTNDFHPCITTFTPKLWNLE